MADLIERNEAYDAIGFERCGRSCADCPTKCTWYYTVRNIPAANQLIPCSEQMMPDGVKVLVLLSNGEYFVMTRHGNTMSDGLRHLNDLQSVTHWMPLPEKL